jgi:hypothetical protein
VAHLADEFQNDIDNVSERLDQFGDLKILGMITKLKFEYDMRVGIRQPEFKILASFVPSLYL